MKMIAANTAFSQQNTIPGFQQKAFKYRFNLLQKNTACLVLSALILICLCSNNPVLGQAQVIGSFPEMQGGVENQTVSSLPVGTAAYATGATVTSFSRNNNTSSVAVDIRATGGHAGPKCLEWACSSTSSAIFTPTAAADAVLQNTSYVVQFFARQNTSTTSRQFNVRVYTNAAIYSEVGTAQTGTAAYQKFTAVITSPTDPLTGKTGYVGIKPKGGSFGTGLTYLVDDICMYAGSAPDVTAPDDATAPVITGYTSSSLSVGWTAPVTGVDGGGYVVVRYPANPVSEPNPTANGIYAVGNTIGTGTVVYIGTANSFTNTGLASSTNYYYKVYVADKAFNYSTTPIVVTGYTGLAGPTLVTFTTPGGCNTSSIILSWTGPLNYNATNNTLLAFIKLGSAITIGTPTNAPGTYNASTNFGSPIAPNYQNDALGKCVYKGDGTNAAGDQSGLTITGLLPNTTYHALVFNVVDAVPTYSAGTIANGTTLAVAVAEPTNQPTAFVKGTVTTTSISPTWVASVAGAQAPLGYYLQASNASSPSDAGIAGPVSDATDIANQTNITSGTANVKVTPNSATTYAGFTGFTAGTMYYFRINSYTNTGSCIDYKSSGPAINVATLPNAVVSPSMSIAGGGNATISWTAAPGYVPGNHTTLVFVKSATAITAGSPSVNPAGYIDNPAFGSGTAYEAGIDPAATCVYNGDGTSINITGLGAGAYHVLILTAVSAANSDGTYSYSAYATTTATSGSIYYWNGGAGGAWTTSTNWNPNRGTVLSSDILIFNNGFAVTPTFPAGAFTDAIAQLQVINNTSLTIQTPASPGLKTISITSNNGLLNSDLIIAAGSTLSINKTAPGTSSVVLAANTTADISGVLLVAASGCTYNTTAAGDLTTVSGKLTNYGTVTCNAANMLVTATGTYEHGINGGTIPTATWNTGSTCLVSGITSGTLFTGDGHGQSFSNFIWDCPLQTSTFVLGAPVTTLPWATLFAESFIVKRTNTGILAITSPASTGNIQRDFLVNNYFQYGGTVAIASATNNGTVQRSLTVNNNFTVSDAIAASPRFQILNTPVSATVAKLLVKGNVSMTNTAILEKVSGAAATAELWFSGAAPQTASFATITGNIDFVASNTGSSNISLLTNANPYNVKLAQGNLLINGNTLTLNGAVSYPAPATGTLGGSSTSNLTMGLGGAAGTLNFTSGYRELKDFIQLLNNSVALGTELVITAGITPGRDSIGTGATLTTNDNLVLRSDNDGTARLAPMTATSTIIGKVTVERYLPMALTSDARRWRLLTAPFTTTNSPTINAAWQEGQSNPDRTNPGPYDPKPGYGTQITKSTVWAANGYDQGSTNNSSLFYYSNGTNTWLAPANTNTVKITDNSGCYMLFARGDRGIAIGGTGVAAAPTTLDPKGVLNVGNVTVAMVASGYQTVGNPYASQIKLDNINFNDTLGKSKIIYLWDPKQAGSTFNVGKFITCAGDGAATPSYTYTGNASAYGSMPGVIESSGAFIVKGNGGNIVFHESDKTVTSSTIGIASRPGRSSATTGSFGIISKFHTDLLVTKDGQTGIADGVAVTFNKNYKNSIDEMDAPKLSSFSTKEDLGIRREGQLLSIERRKEMDDNDTVFLNIARLVGTAYQFGFRPVDFDNAFSAYLEDKFLHTSTEINLAENSAIAFSITTAPESFASDRFQVVFKRNGGFAKPAVAPVAVYPNPVTGGKINLQLQAEMPEGVYGIKLINSQGQVVYNSKITHQSGAEVKVIDIKQIPTKGIYHLEIISATNAVTTLNVSIQ